jgi:hypothetical protein
MIEFRNYERYYAKFVELCEKAEEDHDPRINTNPRHESTRINGLLNRGSSY